MDRILFTSDFSFLYFSIPSPKTCVRFLVTSLKCVKMFFISSNSNCEDCPDCKARSSKPMDMCKVRRSESKTFYVVVWAHKAFRQLEVIIDAANLKLVSVIWTWCAQLKSYMSIANIVNTSVNLIVHIAYRRDIIMPKICKAWTFQTLLSSKRGKILPILLAFESPKITFFLNFDASFFHQYNIKMIWVIVLMY